MRVLVVIAHYFNEEGNAKHASLRLGNKNKRYEALKNNLLLWRTNWGSSFSPGNEHGVSERVYTDETAIDIVVTTHAEHHCLTEEFLKRFSVKNISINLDNPKLLPFASQLVFRDNIENYDWFVYSEDDLGVHDPYFFSKLTNFKAQFGMHRVLQPNRYEINEHSRYLKTYIDADLHPEYHKLCNHMISDCYTNLDFITDVGPIQVARANNPHSGFYALCGEQMKYWVSQSHYCDFDCSFMGPLESAATLGIIKTFSVFKTVERNMKYFEIEHFDNSYS